MNNVFLSLYFLLLKVLKSYQKWLFNVKTQFKLIILLTMIDDMHDCVKYTKSTYEPTRQLMVIDMMIEW